MTRRQMHDAAVHFVCSASLEHHADSCDLVQRQEAVQLKPSDLVSFVVMTDARGKDRSAHSVTIIKVRGHHSYDSNMHCHYVYI